MKDGLQYTTINHVARRALSLSMIEYCIYDSIYNLSHNPRRQGWCTASNEQIADFIGCSEKTVRRAKLKGINEGLLKLPEGKSNKQDRRIDTTQRWYDIVIIRKEPDKMSEEVGQNVRIPRTKCPTIKKDKENNKETVSVVRKKESFSHPLLKTLLNLSKKNTIFAGIMENDWRDILKTEYKSSNNLADVLNYVDKQVNRGHPLSNVGGFIRACLKNDWIIDFESDDPWYTYYSEYETAWQE